MADGFVHTVHAEGSWRNTVEGSGPLPAAYETKTEAVDAGRFEARQRRTEHVIHNADGTIAERSAYGNDPADRPG